MADAARRDYGTTSQPAPGKLDVDGDRESPAADDASLSSDASSSASPGPTVGVKRIEAVSRAWGGSSLFVAYAGLIVMTAIVSLEQNTTTILLPYVTSSFKQHSLISTVGVVNSVFLSVMKPVMAKLSDVTGRLEAFTISIVVYVLGYIQMAASNSVQTYAAAQLFYAAGTTGVQILVQVFVADTTDLLNRALFSTIPDFPFVWTVWAGPVIADSIRATTGSWRWGFGIYAICLPIAFLPLFVSLFLSQRKAKRLGYYPASPYKNLGFLQILKRLWFDLDVFGLLLFTAFVCLLLIPLTLGATAGWDNPSIIAMFVVGGLCLLVFPFWERNKKLAPRAFFPRDIFKSRTVLAAMVIAVFYFMAFYLSVYPYFSSYLIVVHNQSTEAAGHIVNVFSFSSSVTSIVVSLLIKYTARYKYFMVFGSCMYLVGFCLMLAYRTEDASVGTLVGTQIAVGIGGGMLNVPAQLGVQASVTHQEVAAATAVFLTLIEIGGSIGNAIAGAVWTNTLPGKLELYLPPEIRDQALDIYADVEVAASYAVGSPARDAINRAFSETYTRILYGAIAASAVIVPVTLFMRNYKLDQMDQKVKGRVIGGTKTTEGVPEVEAEERRASAPEVTMGEVPSRQSRLPWKRRRES